MLGGRPGGMCCILRGKMDSPCPAHPKLPWKAVKCPLCPRSCPPRTAQPLSTSSVTVGAEGSRKPCSASEPGLCVVQEAVPALGFELRFVCARYEVLGDSSDHVWLDHRKPREQGTAGSRGTSPRCASAPYEHFSPSPFPETRGNRRSASGRNSSSSASSEPRASHVPLLPFTPHHICSYSRVPAEGYLRGGGRRQRAPGALGLQRAPQPRGCKRAWRAKLGQNAAGRAKQERNRGSIARSPVFSGKELR